MNDAARERIEELRRRGEEERLALAADVAGLRADYEARRSQIRFAGTAATAIVTIGTVLFKIFGRTSVAYRVGRLASAAGVLFHLGRAAFKTRRLW
ncbi:MAG TPA: hypothetical protein VGS00_00105 [Thermoanaerobaculia bacterium]|nr:hypothetical protein [Thermoanaerobaculia bacterium]